MKICNAKTNKKVPQLYLFFYQVEMQSLESFLVAPDAQSPGIPLWINIQVNIKKTQIFISPSRQIRHRYQPKSQSFDRDSPALLTRQSCNRKLSSNPLCSKSSDTTKDLVSPTPTTLKHSPCHQNTQTK